MKQRIRNVQHYLEREFPGQVRNTRWDHYIDMQVFEIAHEVAVHRVEMPAAFFENCGNCAEALRYCELTEYMREARTQVRRFSVAWEDGTVRVRSTPL